MANPETKKVLRPKLHYRTFVPTAHKVLAVFAGLIILLGIVESMIFFRLNVTESLILAIVMLLFYAILLFSLLQPKTIKIVKHREVVHKPAMQTISDKIASEIDKESEIRITKPATTSSKTRKKKAKRKKKSARKKTKKKKSSR